jgi:hypothetical protein
MLSATTYDSGQFGKSFRAPCITRRFREAIIAVTCRRGVLHGIARHDDFEHSRSRHRQGTRLAPLSMKAVMSSSHSAWPCLFRSVAGWPTVLARAECFHLRLVSSPWGHFSAAFRVTFTFLSRAVSSKAAAVP